MSNHLFIDFQLSTNANFHNPLLLLLLLLLLSSLYEFFTQVVTGGFHWNPNDSKSTQLSKTLLNILANLRRILVSMASILPLISSSQFFSRFFGIFTRFSALIDITVTFMFHKDFYLSSKDQVFIQFFCFTFTLISWNWEVYELISFLSSYWLQLGLIFWPGLAEPFVCQIIIII